jgi:serine/threonine protein kinase
MAPIDLSALTAYDLRRPEVIFTDGQYRYVTSGKQLGYGGMGAAYLVTRERDGQMPQIIVAKTFREEFMLTLREDEEARRHFDHFERLAEVVRVVHHPNVLPVLGLHPIVDNYVLLTPLGGESLMQTVARHALSPHERVWLLREALRGLSALHAQGIVHRDFTLHNILSLGDHALVFDFDLSVAPGLLDDQRRSYRAHYRGRIMGSPEFSVAPELVDDRLGERPISPRIDVYAAGTALYALFSDKCLYGEMPDVASLFARIAEGAVDKGRSRIAYAEEVPADLWPIIETCLERDPEGRYPDAAVLGEALDLILPNLPGKEKRGPRRRTGGFDHTQVSWSPEEIYETRKDPTVSIDEIRELEAALGRHGYLLEQSLGRVKGHPIFLVMPDPELVAAGRFPEHNTYRKVVTAIDLRGRADARELVERWLVRIYPILVRLRQGYLTTLHKVAHDKEAGRLLLFTEYVYDARFGTQLDGQELTLTETLGLGYLLAESLARLHAHGLAHNHVCREAIVFEAIREQARAVPMLLGLVEPSFEAWARVVDARNLAALIVELMAPVRTDLLRPAERVAIDHCKQQLTDIAAGFDGPSPTSDSLLGVLGQGLGALDGNFEILLKHHGNLGAYADLLVRHSLYRRLFALDVT